MRRTPGCFATRRSRSTSSGSAAPGGPACPTSARTPVTPSRGRTGKTTTTSMIATVLANAGLDPTAVVGGKLNALGSNAKLGKGRLIVVEADESDGSFLRLSPTIAVITNVDAEHLDHYGTVEALPQAFV